MESVNRIIIVLVGVLYLGGGGLFTGIALEVDPGEVNPIQLGFILGTFGFAIGFGVCLAACTIIVTWFIQKGDCRVGKGTNVSLLAKSASLAILGVAIGIHSYTMLDASWPRNQPFRCKVGCLREGKCFLPDCGSGTSNKACICTCPFNYKKTNGTCTECADRFVGPGCSLCKAPFKGERCDEPAYGYTSSGDLREGFILRDRGLAVGDFPVCLPGRCGFDCQEPDGDSLDPGGVCSDLEREYDASAKSCDLHDDCVSKWCEGRCESRGGFFSGICYRDSDCAPFSKCTRRLCSGTPRWSKCECTCTQGFRGGPAGCIPCPGMATRAQSGGRLRLLAFPCSESPREGEEGGRLGQCFLNVEGETACTCNGGWVGEACQCFPGTAQNLCKECAVGWQLDTREGEGLCEKCPVLFGDAVDRFLACGGDFRGKCKRTLARGPPFCECLWPFARDERGSCTGCQLPFEPMNGLCYS